MKREIREKRNQLRETSMKLRELAWSCDFGKEKNLQFRKKQDEEYKKYEFYDKFIKANDKVKKG